MAIQNATALKQKTSRQIHNLVDSRNHRDTSSPTGTTTQLTNADSGKVIFMDASSANTITLPAVATLIVTGKRCISVVSRVY